VGEVAVIGAGVAGLVVATELAGGHRVTVFDRVPVTGGVLGYRQPLVRELTAGATRAGVRFALGTGALRWRERQLLAAGPAGIAWSAADQVVVCTGYRPRTLAELGIAGPRLAGVLPVTAAVHLLEAGAVLGRRIAVLGGGWWARRLAELTGSHTAIVAIGDDEAAPTFAAEAWPSWQAVRLRGTDRVTGVFLEREGATELVSCDAVATAQVDMPYRNVDGALAAGTDGAWFVHPLEQTADQAAAEAGVAATTIVTEWGGH
jgi:NADPH-dependent 2,4-dienoyl-CoA reductase/sulfur reductase-like enzyme